MVVASWGLYLAMASMSPVSATTVVYFLSESSNDMGDSSVMGEISRESGEAELSATVRFARNAPETAAPAIACHRSARRPSHSIGL